MATIPAPTGARRRPRGLAALAAAAAASLLLSPITAVFAVVLGVPLALTGWVLARATGRPAARTVAMVGAGLALGAVPYFLLGLGIALTGGAGSAGHGFAG